MDGNVVTTSVNTHWYALHTHLHQENRAEANLRSWNIEFFYPKQRERRRNEFSGAITYLIKPFFPRYLFARFDADLLLHKVWFTRGVHSVVSFGGIPSPIADEVIEFLKLRADEHGFIKSDEEFKPGDKVIMKSRMLDSIVGIFERELNDSERVMILLQTINYQGHIVVTRDSIRKVTH
jgi:transcriptional antiterminator RfaH